jgi:hypothetical protein
MEQRPVRIVDSPPIRTLRLHNIMCSWPEVPKPGSGPERSRLFIPRKIEMGTYESLQRSADQHFTP